MPGGANATRGSDRRLKARAINTMVGAAIGYNHKKGRQIVHIVADAIREGLKQGGPVAVRGLGTFHIRKVRPRILTSYFDGVTRVVDRKRIFFKAARSVKLEVLKGIN